MLINITKNLSVFGQYLSPAPDLDSRCMLGKLGDHDLALVHLLAVMKSCVLAPSQSNNGHTILQGFYNDIVFPVIAVIHSFTPEQFSAFLN